ncbi:MAG: endolytic transglycosylase MltG [Candidatus Harrisonbacteria bacterium]|nr:endolytic transglycosylase MltG [Candidatus Harrisonbacteria bacterium]
MNLSKIKIITTLGGFLFFSLAIFGYALSPISVESERVLININRGMGLDEIGRELSKANLVRSKTIFVIYGVLSGNSKNLKAGGYILNNNMSMPAIVSVLTAGPPEDVKVTIREGETLAEIDAKLAELGILKPGSLLTFPGKSLEGFLLPDTYRFFLNSDPEEVVKKILSNFHDKAAPILLEKGIEIYKALITASLIEKEVPFLNDRYLVAGIIYKRLAIGMPLQIDAAPSTYDHLGLPSKPIANPGLQAIIAAANPKTSPYLYYLSDPVTKNTIFSATFEEHKENKFRYLKR